MGGRMIRAGLALALAVGVMGLLPSASADDFDHKEPPPEPFWLGGSDPDNPDPNEAVAPEGVCTVFGTVALTDDPVTGTPAHHHFEFVQTTISCNSDNSNLDGDFTNIVVTGHIDGPQSLTDPAPEAHGSTCGESWTAGESAGNAEASDPAGYNNTFTGFKANLGSLNGWNRFHTTTALGVHAWGQFDSDAGVEVEYQFFGRTVPPDDAEMTGAERIARACGLNDGTEIETVELIGVAYNRQV